MLKRKTIETVEEYDSNGKLTKKIVTETLEDDGGYTLPNYPPTYPWTEPYYPWVVRPTVTWSDRSNSTPVSDGGCTCYHTRNLFDEYDPWKPRSSNSEADSILEILRRAVPLAKQ